MKQHLVEINLSDVSMMNLGGTSHVILVSEGTVTAKKVRAAVRQMLATKQRETMYMLHRPTSNHHLGVATRPYEMQYRIKRRAMNTKGRLEKSETMGLLVINAEDVESAIRNLRIALKGKVKLGRIISAVRLRAQTSPKSKV